MAFVASSSVFSVSSPPLSPSPHRCTEGQLQDTWVPLKVPRVAASHVDDQSRLDGSAHFRLASRFLAASDSWYRRSIKNVPRTRIYSLIPAELLGQGQQADLPHRQPSYMVAQHTLCRHVCPCPRLPHSCVRSGVIAILIAVRNYTSLLPNQFQPFDSFF